jgi:hypothetical protein
MIWDGNRPAAGGVSGMIRWILALGGISFAITFAPKSGAQNTTTGTAKAYTPAPNLTMGGAKLDPDYKPPKTSWGEPDLQGTWPINHLIAVPLERPKQYADRLFLSEEELDKAQKALDARNGRFKAGPIPIADTSSKVMRQTSLIVDPPDGRFPALTDYGKQLQAEMNGTYKPGKTVFDGIEDFSSWDRCITRGLPVSMEPRNYNNGIRIMQSPGYVVILLEMAHEARVIPTNGMPPLDSQITEWLGESRGRWEGNTLVVETTNFNGLAGLTSAGVPGSPGPLQPSSPNLRTIERFTRVSAEEIDFSLKVEDPTVLATGSFTIAYPMYLDNSYEMYEYACHEGNTAVRNYIETSRYERAHPKN